MTDSHSGRPVTEIEDDEVSLLSVGSILLRRRRLIGWLFLAGAVLGAASGLLTARAYVSSAVLLPQGSEGSSTGLSAAVSQLGIRIPSSGGNWRAPLYVELLKLPVILAPIAQDTIVVAEENGRKVVLMDLLGVSETNPAARLGLAVRELSGFIKARENKALGTVELSVTTRWPSVSLWLATRLIIGINKFNLETRKSLATEERRFIEDRVKDAEVSLRAAEDRLQNFKETNRIIGSPGAEVQLLRLNRDVDLRQSVLTSLLQDEEEAKIREVRDTPVITVLEEPRLAFIGESRHTVQRLALGAMAGAVLGIIIAFLSHAFANARQASSPEANEFFSLLQELRPRFLRRGN